MPLEGGPSLRSLNLIHRKATKTCEDGLTRGTLLRHESTLHVTRRVKETLPKAGRSRPLLALYTMHVLDEEDTAPDELTPNSPISRGEWIRSQDGG